MVLPKLATKPYVLLLSRGTAVTGTRLIMNLEDRTTDDGKIRVDRIREPEGLPTTLPGKDQLTQNSRTCHNSWIIRSYARLSSLEFHY